MSWSVCFALALIPASLTEPAVAEKPGVAEPTVRSKDGRTAIIVLGEPQSRAADRFLRKAADRWTAAAEQGGVRPIVIGRDTASRSSTTVTRSSTTAEISDHDILVSSLQAAAESGHELWFILLAPRAENASTPALDLRGVDIALRALAAALAPAKQTVAIIGGTDSDAALLNSFSGTNRIVLTAGRSEPTEEIRFHTMLSYAIREPKADLDKDGQVSLLEAWLATVHRAAEFARAEGHPLRLQSLLDDNADRTGSPPEWYHGTRSTRRLSAGRTPDGHLAGSLHLIRSPDEARLSLDLRRRRTELERALETLRQRKPELPAPRYQRELESLLHQLGALYDHEPATNTARAHEAPIAR